MESEQLSFQIHPSLLENFTFLLLQENISFTFKYEHINGPAGYFQVTLERPATKSLPFDLLVEASKTQVSQEKLQIERLMEIDLDYEKIRSDMKALIFYASLSQPAYKSTEKRKDVFSMLHSDLSKRLSPPVRRSRF